MTGETLTKLEVSAEQLNENCIRALEDSGIGRGEFVAVIGSGLSRPYVASLKDLIQKMCAECGVAHTDEQESWEFFEKAYKRNESAYYNVLKKSFECPLPWNPQTYHHVLKIPFKSFVTLNYDSKLPWEFRNQFGTDAEKRFSEYASQLAEPASFHDKRILVAIHGYCNRKDPDWPRKIILKTSDYQREYGQRLFSWWTDLLTRFPCFFIGTSLSEPGLGRVIRTLVRDKNSQFEKLPHLHLGRVQPRAAGPDGLMRYPSPEKPFGVIRQVLYDPMDGDASTGLLRILARFSGEPVDDLEPRYPAPEPIGVKNTALR